MLRDGVTGRPHMIAAAAPPVIDREANASRTATVSPQAP
jgi:hypothetical protein